MKTVEAIEMYLSITNMEKETGFASVKTVKTMLDVLHDCAQFDQAEMEKLKNQNTLMSGYHQTICDRNKKLREELAALKEQNRWIPKAERLPTEEATYVICTDCSAVRELFYLDNKFWNGAEDQTKLVTHWRNLPTAPEQIGEGSPNLEPYSAVKKQIENWEPWRKEAAEEFRQIGEGKG